jgi:hypothetical protein
MTRMELADMLGCSESSLHPAIKKAKERMPSIAAKINFDGFVETSFTVDEIECICRSFEPAMNELQIQLVRENYINHGVTYIQKRETWLKGTDDFVKRAKKCRSIKACANCAYCCGKSKRGTSSKLYPYCKFYDRFIAGIKVPYKHKNRNGVVKEFVRQADIFKDKCDSWWRGEIQYFKK